MNHYHWKACILIYGKLPFEGDEIRFRAAHRNNAPERSALKFVIDLIFLDFMRFKDQLAFRSNSGFGVREEYSPCIWSPDSGLLKCGIGLC